MTANPLKDFGERKHPVFNTLQDHVDHGNAHLEQIGRRDVRWEIREDQAVLDWVIRPHISGHHLKHPMDRRGEAMSAEDTSILNYCLEKAGATARYRSDGSRYSVDQAA